MTIHRINVSRNKNTEGSSIGKIRKELMKEKNNVCDFCHKEFSIYNLELEHSIPVIIGGKLFDKKYLNILCYKCHKEKTYLDKLVINCLKKLKLVHTSSFESVSYIEPNKLIETYKYLLELSKEAKINLENYDNSHELSNHYEENRK